MIKKHTKTLSIEDPFDTRVITSLSKIFTRRYEEITRIERKYLCERNNCQKSNITLLDFYILNSISSRSSYMD